MYVRECPWVSVCVCVGEKPQYVLTHISEVFFRFSQQKWNLI